jgi:hypothetical protein
MSLWCETTREGIARLLFRIRIRVLESSINPGARQLDCEFTNSTKANAIGAVLCPNECHNPSKRLVRQAAVLVQINGRFASLARKRTPFAGSRDSWGVKSWTGKT